MWGMGSMNNIIDESGNSINANGAKFSVELFLQCLEKIELDFTPGGTPQFPTLIMHPDMQKLAYEELNRIENNPEIKKKHDAILQRKRSEWIASSLLTKANRIRNCHSREGGNPVFSPISGSPPS